MALCINCLKREYDESRHEFCDECELSLGIVSRDAYRKRKQRQRMAAGAPPMPREPIPVRCIETGATWCSIAEASRHLGLKEGTLSHALRSGNAIRSTGHHYERMA